MGNFISVPGSLSVISSISGWVPAFWGQNDSSQWIFLALTSTLGMGRRMYAILGVAPAFLKFIYLLLAVLGLIYLLLAVLGLRCCAGGLFSSCGQRDCSGVRVSHGSGVSRCRAQVWSVGFRSCSPWAQQLHFPGSGAQVQWLWHVDSGTLRRRSSWTRNCACVSCTGGWILYHWATREAPSAFWLLKFT